MTRKRGKMKLSLSIQTPDVEPILPLALLTGSFPHHSRHLLTLCSRNVVKVIALALEFSH